MQRNGQGPERYITLIGIPVMLSMATYVVMGVVTLNTQMAELRTELHSGVLTRMADIDKFKIDVEQRIRILEARR